MSVNKEFLKGLGEVLFILGMITVIMWIFGGFA